MKFAIIKDKGSIKSQYTAASMNKIQLNVKWSDEVLGAEKKYETGFDAAKKVDIFTVFEIIGNNGLDSLTIHALLSKEKNMLIFASSFGIKEFYWKTVYIRHLFEGL